MIMMYLGIDMDEKEYQTFLKINQEINQILSLPDPLSERVSRRLKTLSNDRRKLLMKINNSTFISNQ